MAGRQSLLNHRGARGCQSRLHLGGWLTAPPFYSVSRVESTVLCLRWRAKTRSKFPSVMWSGGRGEAAAPEGREGVAMWEKRRGCLLEDWGTKRLSVPDHLGSPGSLCGNPRLARAVREPRSVREGSSYAASPRCRVGTA